MDFRISTTCCYAAHEAAARGIGGERGRSNGRIIWFPKNTTSHYQPCDQGIVRELKAHASNRFLPWQISQYDSFIDHNTAIPKANLLQAIHRIVAAWDHDVKNKPIVNCFMKSSAKLYEPAHLSVPGALSTAIGEEDPELLKME